MRYALENTTTIKTFLACLLCLALFTTTARAETETGLPESFSATYILTKGPLTLGKMTRTLSHNDDGSYTFRSQSSPIGYARMFTKATLEEETRWVYHNDSLRPLNYKYIRDGEKPRHVELSFDWTPPKVTNTVNEDPWNMSIQEDTLDKLLYHLALMHDLQAGKRTLKYNIADGGSLKDYEFEVLGEEVLDTKLGKLNTIKLRIVRKKTTTLWCAEDYNYIPVRLEQDEDYGLARMNLTELSGITRSQH